MSPRGKLLELEALRHLPKASLVEMLDKARDVSCLLSREMDQIDMEIRDPSQDARKDALKMAWALEAEWQLRLRSALYERRPALQRIVLDGFLDD